MRIDLRSLGLIGLLGGLGGAINAWLCYAKIPVPVSEHGDFSWYIIPAGALHGSLLATITVGGVALLWNRKWRLRSVGPFLVGWVSGWLAFIPIYIYISWDSSGLSVWGPPTERVLKITDVFNSLIWPIGYGQGEDLWGRLWMPLAIPYAYFGLVGLAYSFSLNLWRQLSSRDLWSHLLVASGAGFLGSLWWWISYTPWWFSLLHGTIWGSLVGFGMWKSHLEKSG